MKTEIISIRIKNTHYSLLANEMLSPQEFLSINKAKAHSKKLGGAGKVRAFKTKDEAYDFLRENKKGEQNG